MKKIDVILLFLISLILHVHLNAQISNTSIQQAEVYYDAGNYTQAQNLYLKKLEEPLPDWQKAIIQYNLGTLLLLENNLNGASRYFLLADSLNEDLPLLQQREAINNAWTQLMRIKQENTKDQKDYITLFAQMKELFDDIYIAKQANCHLQLAEGNKDITADCSDLNIQNIQNEAQQQLTHLLSDYSNYEKIHNMDTDKQIESIKNLIIQYNLTLIEHPIQEDSLSRLSDMQQTLATSLKQSFFLEAQRYLAQGKKVTKESIVQSRMFIEMACNSINDLLQALNHTNDLEVLLERAIHKQKLALQLNRLKNETAQELSEDADRLVGIIQTQVNQLAEEFLTMVVIEQKKNPSTFPWEKIITTFAQGQKNAIEALELIKSSPNSFLSIKSLQNKTLSAWNEISDLLQTKSSSSQNVNTLPDQEKNPSQQSLKDQELNTILRNLQDMETDDRSHPHLKTISVPQEEERPW